MPIAIIAVVIIAALGAGFFFFTNNDTLSPTPDASTEVATRPTDNTEEAVSAPTTNETTVDETDTADDTPDMSADVDSSVAPAADTESATTYTDGTYTASATYLTPRRTEHLVGVTLTIENDIVVDSTVTYDGVAGEYSNDNQARFDQAYTAEVIGQPLDTISLSRVGSASLTSGAFNEAKAKIATEARS